MEGRKQRHIVLFRNQKKREDTMTTSEIWNATRKGQQPERGREEKKRVEGVRKIVHQNLHSGDTETSALR